MRAAVRRPVRRIVAVVALAITTAAVSALWASQSVHTVGCLERDAAARSAIYRLVAKIEGGTRSYRLTTTGSLDLGPYVGKSVDVEGTATKKTVGGRDEWELAVQSFKVASEHCE